MVRVGICIGFVSLFGMASKCVTKGGYPLKSMLLATEESGTRGFVCLGD